MSELHCVICTQPITKKTRRDSVTCSPECSKKRHDLQREMDKLTKCVYCHRPASADEQERYARWRKWEKQGKDDEQSAQALLKENVRLKLRLKEIEDKAVASTYQGGV